MDHDERLKIDYEQTTQYNHKLADIRFRLLALVPIATGAAIALVEKSATGPTMLTVGLMGFIVTLGITFYDQRNTQIYNAMQWRARALEILLDFDSTDRTTKQFGGTFLDRPGRSRKMFGILLMWHDRALAIIYASAFAGWGYLILDGLFKSLDISTSWPKACAQSLIPILVFFLFVIEFERLDKASPRSSHTGPLDVIDSLENAKEVLDGSKSV